MAGARGFSPRRPGRPWGVSSLLPFDRPGVVFPRIQQQGREVDSLPPFSVVVKPRHHFQFSVRLIGVVLMKRSTAMLPRAVSTQCVPVETEGREQTRSAGSVSSPVSSVMITLVNKGFGP